MASRIGGMVMRFQFRASLCAVLLGSCSLAFSQAGKAVGDAPRVNGPRVYGARPGHPFLFRLPVTGEKPMRFFAQGLPPGLTIGSATGMITGSVQAPQVAEVDLRVVNRFGEGRSHLRIAIGDKLALTPPMGWSSWDLMQSDASAARVKAQADALVASGLADHGYAYINIDDGWEEQLEGPKHTGAPTRDGHGNILPNKRFADMPALTAYLHAKGLKAGLYTSPGPMTCGRFEGSAQHEKQDADQYARWHFDFLKYDLCSYKPGQGTARGIEEPYVAMGELLAAEDRDMLLSVSTGGGREVGRWAHLTGAQMWRTGEDLAWGPKGVYSTWDNIRKIVSDGSMAKWAGPGGWNDPDDLVIGHIAYIPADEVWPEVKIDRILPPPLTPDEQLTQMSLWSLLAAPLIIGGDLTTLDEFSLEMLSNDEVIAVDQDALGSPAQLVSAGADRSMWVKELTGGGKAVGFFNMGEREEDISATWAEIGVRGKQCARDLWRHEDLVSRADGVVVRVPPHGVRLLTLTAGECRVAAASAAQ